MEKLTLTVKETAEALGVSEMTFYKLMRRADHPVPSIRTGNGKSRRLISRVALENWIGEETEMSKKGRN